MVVLDIRLDNLYAFKNFHLNLTYPKKIVGSTIEQEHLAGHPNFRYKKVNILMGANASGKSTLGRALMKIFNFIDKKDLSFLVDSISNQEQEAMFSLDMASSSNVFYRIVCEIKLPVKEKHIEDCVDLRIQAVNIRADDSYESCVSRLEGTEYSPEKNYLLELTKMEPLDWLFLYPETTDRILRFPKNDKYFLFILENILKALDPSIQSVEKSNDVENAYVVRLKEKAAILQDGERFTTNLLSSGTKAGVEIAQFISSMKQGHYSFYYCDEKFSYIHSDIEKALLSLMIDFLRPNDQLFFTTHNTDILDMNLPKHTFTFLRNDPYNTDCPITCIDAASILKRNTSSLKNAVENDLFSCAPSVDRIYAIAEREMRG